MDCSATRTKVRTKVRQKDSYRVDSEGRELIQEGFVMGLRLSEELAECEGNSQAVRIQTMDSHQLCKQIGRGAKGTINDKMRSLSQAIHVAGRRSMS